MFMVKKDGNDRSDTYQAVIYIYIFEQIIDVKSVLIAKKTKV